MIKGIGVDVLEIVRVENVYARHGERFIERILTEREKLEFHQRKNKANYLAKQFAAKEAIAKSFGTGIGAISFKSIEVLRTDQGQPVDTGQLVTAYAIYEID